MWFKKEKAPQKESSLPPCRHKYKDFDWYLEANYYNETDTYEVSIYEPYVCILCKYRMNKLLHRINGRGYRSFKSTIDMMHRLYPNLRPRAYVEDEIIDMQLVDQYYLDAYYKLHSERKEKGNA